MSAKESSEVSAVVVEAGCGDDAAAAAGGRDEVAGGAEAVEVREGRLFDELGSS